MEEYVRVRLDLSYEGTGFAGWAKQPGLRTVEGMIEDGLQTVLRCQPVRLVVAGRTDSGVHATAQVAHVDLPMSAWLKVPGRAPRTPEAALVSRLRGVLPADIVVRHVSVAPEGFDARFSALFRRYRYRIADSVAAQNPLHRRFVHWNRRELDIQAMNEAALPFIGEHDFKSYCRPRKGATTIRTLQRFRWERVEVGVDAGLVVATVQADAFCHNMVRALVGGSVVVGEGRAEASWAYQILLERRRDPLVAVMPACGLTLEQVSYPEASELAARAILARARRELPSGGL